MEKIRLAEAVAATKGSLLQGSLETEVTGIAIDSREVQPGQLFFAFPGSRADGHLYAADALRHGASAAVISRHVDAGEGQPLILVKDTLQALQDLAGYYRGLFQAPVVAVTGSTGKTTTKDLIAGVLQVGMKVLKTEGNQNNEIGLPLTLLRLEHDTGALVLEMAMRGRGEIAALCRISQPLVGVITNIGMTHLERLGSLQAIAEAKGELLEALPADGCAILNGEDDWQRRLALRRRCEVLFYGLGEDCAVRARDLLLQGLEGTGFVLQTPLGEVPCLLPLPGRHNIFNALAAAAAGHRFGLSPEKIAMGLGRAVHTGMRLEIKKGIQDSTLVDDTYNASPDSVRAALQLLSDIPGPGRKIAVLGDMYELGEAKVAGHRSVGELAAAIKIDHLYTVGELARNIAEGALAAGLPACRISVFPDNLTAMAFIRGSVGSGDIILVKGSRGARMEEIVASLSEDG